MCCLETADGIQGSLAGSDFIVQDSVRIGIGCFRECQEFHCLLMFSQFLVTLAQGLIVRTQGSGIVVNRFK